MFLSFSRRSDLPLTPKYNYRALSGVKDLQLPHIARKRLRNGSSDGVVHLQQKPGPKLPVHCMPLDELVAQETRTRHNATVAGATGAWAHCCSLLQR